MRLNKNYIAIKIDDSNEYIKLKGLKLFLDTSFEPEKNAQTVGEVVAVSEIFFSKKSQHSNPYDVPMELQVGDKVIFHFMAAATAIKDGRYMVESGEKIIFLPYDRLYVAIREEWSLPCSGGPCMEDLLYHTDDMCKDGCVRSKPTTEVIPLNGIVLVEPEAELFSTSIILPDSVKKESQTRGKVKYLGALVKSYKDYQELGPDKDEIRVGDTVIFKDNCAIPLQWEHHNILPKMYRMHRMDILGKIETT